MNKSAQRGATRFRSYEKLLRLLCRRLAASWREDEDELFSEALLHYVRAVDRFDGSIPLRQWVAWYVRTHLKQSRVKRARANRILPRADLDPDQIGTGGTRGGFDLREFVAGLSAQGALVARLVTDPPPPLQSRIRRACRWTQVEPPPRTVRACLRDYLEAAGWTAKGIAEAFQEVRRALQ